MTVEADDATAILIAAKSRFTISGDLAEGARQVARRVLLACDLPRKPDDDRKLIERIVAAAPAGVYLRKIEDAADVEKVSALMRVAEAQLAAQTESLVIVAAVENARAALALTGFNRIIPRLIALVLDPARLAADIGAAISSPTVIAVRAQLPLAARVSGVAAGLWLDRQRGPGINLYTAAERARDDGYSAFVLSTPDEAEAILGLTAD